MNTMIETKSTPAPAIETAPLTVRRHETMSPGDVAEQGDFYLVCIEKMPKSAKPRNSRQIAEGETKGSKHVVEGGEVYDANAKECVALIKKATNGAADPGEEYISAVFTGPCVLTHPQHQHQSFPKDTVIVSISQRNLDAEEREIRARD